MKSSDVKWTSLFDDDGFRNEEIIASGKRLRLKAFCYVPQREVTSLVSWYLRTGSVTGPAMIQGQFESGSLYMVDSYVSIPGRGIVFDDGVFWTTDVNVSTCFVGVSVDVQ